ncbi:hypothetical protein [Streptomyces sp. CC77]|uniref:hypothetical protein n=1 Tax=Streptomyces sp. CC77 TaxID=1906739 RepID=UPI0011139CEE|nr:hypothetical protein [Streptomyces sp. CC77]
MTRTSGHAPRVPRACADASHMGCGCGCDEGVGFEPYDVIDSADERGPHRAARRHRAARDHPAPPAREPLAGAPPASRERPPTPPGPTPASIGTDTQESLPDKPLM